MRLIFGLASTIGRIILLCVLKSKIFIARGFWTTLKEFVLE